MKSVAIICEFNPFHNGHALIASEARKLFPDHAIIAIMSGNTVQRGDFSIFDKYDRARCAVQNGYDLVLELPFPFSCSSAEQFANAGVCLAESISAEYLVFGSESGDITSLCESASLQASPEFKKSVTEYAAKNRGISVIEAREKVLTQMYGKKLAKKSNDILATEYIRAINENSYALRPIAIHRTIPFSATSARKALQQNDLNNISYLLPQNCEIPKTHPGLSGLAPLILGMLRLDIGSDNGNGIVNALKTSAGRAASFDEFINALPTKTYTLARLRREIIGYVFDIGDNERNEKPEYTVLLAASSLGLEYFSEIKKSLSLPVLTRVSDRATLSARGLKQLEIALRCDSVYALGFSEKTVFTPFKVPYIKK